MSATTSGSRRVVQALGRSMSWSRMQKAVVVGSWIAIDHFCEPRLCDLFNNRRIYPSLRLAAILPRISDSEGEITGVYLIRAIVTAMVIALTTPAFADIPDYESIHKRLADVLGSRAQAEAAYH